MALEKIPLHSLARDVEGEGAESEGLEEKARSDVKKAKWKRCKGIFITLMTLLGYAFLNAAISMISPFYPIVTLYDFPDPQYNWRLCEDLETLRDRMRALDQHVSFYVVGFVIGMAPLCIAVFSPVIGYLLPHLGLKFTQLAGLYLAGGSLILFGFVSIMPTPAWFITFSFLLRIVEGVGTAMYSTASYTLLTQMYSEKKGTLVGLIELAISAGYAIGAPMGGGLQQVGGFKLPFVLIGGITVIFMFVLLVLVPSTECSSQTLPWRLVLKLFSNVLFITLVLSLIISLSAMAAVTATYGRFLHRHFHLQVAIIGVCYLAATTTYVIGSILAGPLTDKLVPRILIIVGLVIAGIGCIFVGPPGFLTEPQLWISIVASSVMGLGIPFAIVPIYSDIYGISKFLSRAMSSHFRILRALCNFGIFAQDMKVVTDDDTIASTLSGIIVASFSAGEFLGPVIGSSLVAALSFRAMVGIYGLVLIGMALAVLLVTLLYLLCIHKFRKEGLDEEPAISS